MFRYLPTLAVAGGAFMLVMGALLMMGCVATQKSERAFSPEWTELQRVNAELGRREAHINRVDRIVLMGSPEEGGAYVGKDADGNPKLNIGQETGWKLDLDYDGGPEAELKYELEWDFANPKKGEKK